MNIHDLTISQLKRAAAIKEQIAKLNKELDGILGTPDGFRAGRRKTRKLSAAARRRIATAQRARWAKIRKTKPVTKSVKPANKAKS
jgi:hypothetical protein